MGVELGSDAALFPGIESRLGNRGCNTATTRADARDVNLFLVDILQFEYKVRLRGSGHGTKIMVGFVKHLPRPFLCTDRTTNAAKNQSEKQDAWHESLPFKHQPAKALMPSACVSDKQYAKQVVRIKLFVRKRLQEFRIQPVSLLIGRTSIRIIRLPEVVEKSLFFDKIIRPTKP